MLRPKLHQPRHYLRHRRHHQMHYQMRYRPESQPQKSWLLMKRLMSWSSKNYWKMMRY